MYVPDSYIIAHTFEDTLATEGSHVLVFNLAWLFLAAMLHFVLVTTPTSRFGPKARTGSEPVV